MSPILAEPIQAHSNLETIYYFQEDYGRIIQKYEETIKGGLSYIEAHENLGITYYKLKQYHGALDQLATASKLSQNNSIIKNKVKLLRKLVQGAQ